MNSQTSLPINQEQIKSQLKALGYRKGDKIYLRKFPPKGVQGYPKNYEYTIPELPKLQDSDGGLYIVVNGGGHCDKDVTQFRSCFFEFDDRPVEEQVTAWQSSNLPEPSMQVLTRKSVHTYYILSDGCTEAQWRELQEDLIDYLDSDKNLKNPSRVMRLAGAWHIAKDQDPVMCEIIHYSEARYTYAQLRAIVPEFKKLEPQLQQTHNFPLSDVLHRDILPRLNPEQIYNWSGHKWQRSQSGKKYRGCCPWHESQTGTAFYIDYKENTWLWRCPSCEIGGTAVEYHHRLKGGNGHPKGKEFVDIVKELAGIAGVALPEFKPEQVTSEYSLNPVEQEVLSKFTGYHETLDRIDQLEDEYAEDSELEWNVRNFAYENKLSSKGFSGSTLLRLARARRDGLKAINLVDAHDILEKHQDGRKWLIAGLIPLGSTIVLSASGGSGKTSLCYNFAKNLALGLTWSGLPVRQGKSLIVQTDEPEVDIADKLDAADFYTIPRGLVSFIKDWRFTQVRQLEQFIRKYGYKFIVIDSYTAAHAGTGIELTKSSAGDNIYKLRNIAQDLECTILIIHHHNKMNEMRDSSTIHDNASEIWKLFKDKNDDSLGKDDWVLEVPKSRAGLVGKYILTRNPSDYSWLFNGSVDTDDKHIGVVRQFFNEHKEEKFSASKVAENLRLEFNSAQATLERARRFGMIRSEWVRYTKEGINTRYRVYFALESQSDAVGLESKNIDRLSGEDGLLSGNSIESQEFF